MWEAQVRKLIYNLWSTHAPLMDLLPGGLYGDRAEFTTEIKPFGVLIHQGPLPGISSHMQARTTLWVHDEPGDYTRIDEALRVARNYLLSAVPVLLDGVWLNDVRWEGTSDDLLDTERRTNVKNATFLLTGSGM